MGGIECGGCRRAEWGWGLVLEGEMEVLVVVVEVR